MKTVIKFTCFSLLAVSFSSCLKFDELRENPNNPISVAPSLLFTSTVPTPASAFSDLYRNAQYHNFIAADLGVSPPVNYLYGSAGFSYETIRNVDKMAAEAEKANAQAYIILAKFFKAYYYVQMTMQMGDIPLSEAMKGAEIPRPKYDTQKEVFIQCLNWLDEANLELDAYINSTPGATVEGDIYFGGNLRRWQKAINAFSLRTLISLSKKDNDAELNVKGRFQKIIQDPTRYPLMGGLFDNMQITHRDEDGFRGTYNPIEQIVTGGIVYADTYIDLLKSYQDPRLQKVADPTPKALAANPTNEAAVRADFNSYDGSDISVDLQQNNARKSNGDFSFPNRGRFLNFVGQPSILIGYAEQELNIAEAAHRGWISSDAKTHYDNGVLASLEFYGASPGDYLTNKAPYLSGAAGLKRIHEQMYLTLAENSGWTSWFMTRRTGVPEYKFSTVNNVTQLPLRWAYPVSELTDNTVNYKAALVSQFGSEVDDRDQLMWLLK